TVQEGATVVATVPTGTSMS
nr:immunoglobulin heavy chain junction region [Mus musculus]